jgi:hypothetical protein
MGKLTPKRCPNCGSTNIHNQELESPHEWEEWYDVYCRDCEWSGDISPDLPLEKTTPEEMKELEALKNEAQRGECVSFEQVKRKQRANKPPKTLEEIKTQLGSLKPYLKEKFGVETIGVFGSYCRGEQTKKSDLDILIEYSTDTHPGLFELLELENFLTDKLGVKVDLGTKRSLKPHIGERILDEVIMI